MIKTEPQILNADPLSPEFRNTQKPKWYCTTFFKKELFFPSKEDKIIELKSINYFSLSLPYAVLKSYVGYLTKKVIYKKGTAYINDILEGKEPVIKIDLTREIYGFLPLMINNGFLIVYDTEKSVYHTHIEYFEEGRHFAPAVGRGEIIYQIDRIEICRSTTWVC